MRVAAAQILKADGVARQAELQEQLERVKAENAQLKSCLSDAARVHAFEVESLRTDMDSVYNAVGSVGRDMSRSSDEQLAQLADVNKALVSVIKEKDRLIQHQQDELKKLWRR